MSKVDKTTNNLMKCRCVSCPTYTVSDKIKALPQSIGDLVKAKGDISKLGHLEGMYCAYEKSNHIDREKGCLCDKCEVWKNYSLETGYFCRQTGGK